MTTGQQGWGQGQAGGGNDLSQVRTEVYFGSEHIVENFTSVLESW